MRVVRAIVFFLFAAGVCLAQDASSAIVTIRGMQNGSAVSGTGFIAAPNGTIVTNLHLVKELSDAKVELSSGDVFDSFTLVASDARRDLAIIRIAGFDLPFITLGNSNQVHPGDAVTVITTGKDKAQASVHGFVPADGFRLMQVSASAQSTASGGVLLAADGSAIGVLGYRGTSPLAMAVPINYARGMLDIAPEESAKAVVPASPQSQPKPEVAKESVPSGEAAPSVKTAPGIAMTAPAPKHPVTAMSMPSPPAPPPAVTSAPAPVSTTLRAAEPSPVAVAPAPERRAETPVVHAAEKTPIAEAAPATPKTEMTRSIPVRKIYIEPIGKGEGPTLLHDDIVRYLEQSHFQVVDTRDAADAVLSGTAKFANIRVEKFRARLSGTDDRELWSGELSTGGWIRAASGTIARALVKNIVHAVGQPGLQP